VFKRPISADGGPYMLLFPDIYVFEGLTTFPRENATFRNGTLRIFPKYSRKFQILCLVIVWKSTKCRFPGNWEVQEKSFHIFLLQKSICFHFKRKMAV